jgi:Tfp pilus assembly protein PilO
VKIYLKNLKSILPKTLTRREKKLITALIILIVLCVIYYFHIPAFKLLCLKQKELEDLKISSGAEQRQYYSSKERTEELLIDSNNIMNKVPTDPDMTQFITNLDYICEAHNVKILTIEPQKHEEANELCVLPVDVTINGDYIAFLRILKELENSKRMVEVSEVSLINQGPNKESNYRTNPNPWIMRFVIKLYYLPSPEGM